MSNGPPATGATRGRRSMARARSAISRHDVHGPTTSPAATDSARMVETSSRPAPATMT